MNTATANGSAGFSAGADAGGPVAGFDPVLISLIRRSMPNLMAYDLAGVQPMSGPTGLIFAMRSRYGGNDGDETFYNEVDSAFSGQNDGRTLGDFTGTAVGMGTTAQAGDNPSILNPTSGDQSAYNVGQGMKTTSAEALGDAAGNQFNEMGFSIEKVLVEAKSRALTRVLLRTCTRPQGDPWSKC